MMLRKGLSVFLNYISVAVKNPSILIAIFAPMVMSIVSSVMKDASISSGHKQLTEFLYLTGKSGNYECAWFDVKLQIYGLLVGYMISFGSFIEYKRQNNLSTTSTEEHSSKEIYFKLTNLYFFFMPIVCGWAIVGPYFGPGVVNLYLQTCNSIAFPPIESFITWLRISLLLPFTLIYFHGKSDA